MKITFELSTEEAKELITPGPAQVTAYQNLTSAFISSWMQVSKDIMTNARSFSAREKV